MCTGVGEKRYEVIDSVDSRLYPHKGSGALKEDAARLRHRLDAGRDIYRHADEGDCLRAQPVSDVLGSY